MCFRGQVSSYYLKRPVPNPLAADDDGREELLLPAFWRAFLSRLSDRPVHGERERANLLLSLVGDALPASVKARMKAYAEDGFLSLEETLVRTDLPSYPVRRLDLPTLAEQDRHRLFPKGFVRVDDNTREVRELPLILQHYGVPTTGLDVTFDLSVAMFFALNKYEEVDGTARFRPISRAEHPRVYGLVFHDPPVLRTADMTTEVPSFAAYPPAAHSASRW